MLWTAMQINYLKIIQCDFLDFCFRFRFSLLKCTYDKNYRPLHALSRKTCKIGSVSNTCSILYDVRDGMRECMTDGMRECMTYRMG